MTATVAGLAYDSRVISFGVTFFVVYVKVTVTHIDGVIFCLKEHRRGVEGVEGGGSVEVTALSGIKLNETLAGILDLYYALEMMLCLGCYERFGLAEELAEHIDSMYRLIYHNSAALGSICTAPAAFGIIGLVSFPEYRAVSGYDAAVCIGDLLRLYSGRR